MILVSTSLLVLPPSSRLPPVRRPSSRVDHAGAPARDRSSPEVDRLALPREGRRAGPERANRDGSRSVLDVGRGGFRRVSEDLRVVVRVEAIPFRVEAAYQTREALRGVSFPFYVSHRRITFGSAASRGEHRRDGTIRARSSNRSLAPSRSRWESLRVPLGAEVRHQVELFWGGVQVEDRREETKRLASIAHGEPAWSSTTFLHRCSR